MPDDKEVLDRLDRYAKAIARNILAKFDLEHDRHRVEDIAQNLFLAGWQVWKAKGNEGLAKHRMSDRAKNQTEKLAVELQQPQPVSGLPMPTDGGRDDVDVTEAYHAESSDMPYRRLRVEGLSRASPLEDQIVQDYLERLTERQRRMVECRMAQMTVREISQTLGVSTSTIERELTLLQKGFHRDQGD
jgi:DNA-directed RNA polymerase specialized sigma24 family protein